MNWTTIESLRDYYIYSLIPKKSEYKLLFGKDWEEFYLIDKEIKPTLTGFISYVKNQLKNGLCIKIIFNNKTKKRIKKYGN